MSMFISCYHIQRLDQSHQLVILTKVLGTVCTALSSCHASACRLFKVYRTTLNYEDLT